MNITGILGTIDSAVKFHAETEYRSSKNGSAAANPPLTGREIAETVERLNKSTADMSEKVSFSFNEKTNSVIVQFIDREKNEVVREFPSKDLMRVAEHIHDYLGILVDETR